VRSCADIACQTLSIAASASRAKHSPEFGRRSIRSVRGLSVWRHRVRSAPAHARSPSHIPRRCALACSQRDDGPTDGLGAMVGGWSAAREAVEKSVPFTDIDLIQGVQRSNEVDCKVTMEIVRYLRANH
jgi:hypothetical protein